MKEVSLRYQVQRQDPWTGQWHLFKWARFRRSAIRTANYWNGLGVYEYRAVDTKEGV